MSGEWPLPEMVITALLARWPSTANVFHKHNMSCVGCAVAPFFTVAEAAAVYRISVDLFTAELEQAIQEEEAQQKQL